RRYWAAHYAMSGGTVINSTAHNATLAETVGSFWKTKLFRRELFESLVIDFHSRGGDLRGDAGPLQIGAAIRLLYYFPDPSDALGANRLRELDVSAKAAATKQDNGVDALDFIKGVNFSEHPEVQRELLDIFRRTIQPQIAAAAMPGIPNERDAEVLAKVKL